MVKAISLQDYYNRREAFYDPDRMVRIAAIHRAGGKLDRNSTLREILRNILSDTDKLVSRYAAITLAQSGDEAGIRYLLEAIVRAQGEDREELESCLHNCSRFPFAVVLNELLFIESISNVVDADYSKFLHTTLYLTSDRFYEKCEEDPSSRQTFLRILRALHQVRGLRMRPHKMCDLGWILAEPRGKQPGFLFCPERRLFLKFEEETVLNRELMGTGRQVLFVSQGKSGYGDTDCLYVFEDKAIRLAELSQLIEGAVTECAGEFGLLPGVVASKRESPECVDVLCANGKSFQERYRVQRASLSQFVLIEEDTDLGRSMCHFVPNISLKPDVIQKIVSDYAAFKNLVMAQITTIHQDKHPKTDLPRCEVRTEDGQTITTYISNPRQRSWVFMKVCHVCQAAGEVVCYACEGRGENPCYGTYSCSRCKGSGTLEDGRECLICSGSGSLQGCQGKGQIDCPVCGGDGNLQCDNCHGSGEYQPRRPCPKCHGSGDFSVTCQKCGGSGNFTVTCRKCGGSGRFRGGTCWSCQGAGRKELDCGACEGTGSKTLECTACGGQGYWEAKPCNACGGHGSRECFYCHGDAQIQCPVCHGQGRLPCRKCREQGKISCPHCQGNRLIFHAKVDCLPS
ncbi:MAG: hypothetical protein KatS3mg106_597 [Gemmataceae bacterium]|jgi:hypothetical protein|nr:MAG: hypothetical protein KatS3mg106_597 [Gemmataceae bacterium]